MYHKLIFVALALLMLATTAQAQEEARADKAQQKKERIEKRKAERLANHKATLKALEERDFVIEVFQFTDQYGRTIQLNTTTNFVSVLDSLATLQLAFPGAIGGSNGLGGATLDGRVIKLDIVKQSPENGVRFQLRVFGSGFSAADMFIDVDPDGYANIRYSGAYGAAFTLRGNFLSPEKARIFKGMPRY